MKPWLADALGIIEERESGPWTCKKCGRRGNYWWAAFHLHRKDKRK